MNRILLIGNGFDLAHSMPTKYTDFIKSIIVGSLNKFFLEGVSDFELFSIQKIRNDKTYEFISVLKEIEFSKFHQFIKFKSKWANSKATPESSTEEKDFIFICKSQFIADVFNETFTFGWVDIEHFFFQSLLHSYKYYHKKREGVIAEKINSINYYFGILRNYLQEYISGLTLPELSKNIEAKIFREMDVFNSELKPWNDTLILNFNYTHLIEKYITASDNGFRKVKHIQIHGKVKSSTNPIIFGYGDEMYDEFKDLEINLQNSELTYFKYSWYGLSANYRNLIRFIESDNYKVEFMGHSCGLSDRLLLNTIVENDNCKEIKFNYHKYNGGSNYIDLYQNIARIFSIAKRADMRKKVASYPEVKPLVV